MEEKKKVLTSPKFIAEFIEIVGWEFFNENFEIHPIILSDTLALMMKDYAAKYS